VTSPSEISTAELEKLQFPNQDSIATSGTTVRTQSNRIAPSIAESSTASTRPLPIRKIQGKHRRRGTRGNSLKKNPSNTSQFYRSCPKRSWLMQASVNYHNRVNRTLFKLPNAVPELEAGDLDCEVCTHTSANSVKQFKFHFPSKKHMLALWNKTPKYCRFCKIYTGFTTPELCKSHISSSAHCKKAGNTIPTN